MEKMMQVLRNQSYEPTRKRCDLQVPCLPEEVTMQTVRVIGEGSCGIVSLVKVNDRSYFAKKTTFAMSMAEEFLRKELRILNKFSHVPNIVRCYSPSLEFESIGDDVRICKYAPKGTLSDILEGRDWKLSENDVRRCTLMILRGLKALHGKGYVHCDLKSTNILVFCSEASGEIYEVKICDFGLAREPGESSFSHKRKYRGTAPYMSPESIGPSGKIGPDLDIWSLGCLVIEMIGLSEAPVEDADGGGFYRWEVPENISAEAKDFVSKCMKLHPFERWTTERLMDHPFVAKVASQIPM
ncbi:PREDICTED: mitogen-activated protein kinase kinase kinase 1 [Tarenaya hassleriana]|uniref:mitogen-activated protein kinase kinase kinase 1 n=1 Tax=Tarenaya hassleriana TaxID=28532 RepID=UPI00053C3122|nr:PREDICTED: mitogen-activated protein kinase kinase kinase 1 [Tarenaya hassleriana]